MTGKRDESVENTNADKKYVSPENIPNQNRSPNIPNELYDFQSSSKKITADESNRTVAVSSFFSSDLEELLLDARVISMMEKSGNYLANKGKKRAHMCKICGKEDERSNIKDHIEANHLEGIVIPCNFCEKTFRSRNALRSHILRQHKKLRRHKMDTN